MNSELNIYTRRRAIGLEVGQLLAQFLAASSLPVYLRNNVYFGIVRVNSQQIGTVTPCTE